MCSHTVTNYSKCRRTTLCQKVSNFFNCKYFEWYIVCIAPNHNKSKHGTKKDLRLKWKTHLNRNPNKSHISKAIHVELQVFVFSPFMFSFLFPSHFSDTAHILLYPWIKEEETALSVLPNTKLCLSTVQLLVQPPVVLRFSGLLDNGGYAGLLVHPSVTGSTNKNIYSKLLIVCN